MIGVLKQKISRVVSRHSTNNATAKYLQVNKLAIWE